MPRIGLRLHNQAADAFWMVEAPRNTSKLYDYSDEQNFQFSVPTQGTVNVTINGSLPLATITQSGWYAFVETFETGGTYIQHNFLVYSVPSAGMPQLVASNANTSAMLSSNLGAIGLEWLTLWQNGFANDVLAIDNIQSGLLPFMPVPEPSAMALVAGCAGVFLLIQRRSRSG